MYHIDTDGDSNKSEATQVRVLKEKRSFNKKLSTAAKSFVSRTIEFVKVRLDILDIMKDFAKYLFPLACCMLF